MRINFASSNPHKIAEASDILREFGIEIKPVKVKKLEIQSDSLHEIAQVAALHAARQLGSAVVVEDAGLYIDALNGFPGPYSAYVFRTIGNRGILKLMDGIQDRRARFVSVVAYAEPNGFIKTFEGITKGMISYRPRGNKGFGFDPIFIPEGGGGLTYAEMDMELKNKVSHRGKAFREFARWFKAQKGG